MDLFEYQARDLFEQHGVPVLRGIVATTPEEARAAAYDLSYDPYDYDIAGTSQVLSLDEFDIGDQR